MSLPGIELGPPASQASISSKEIFEQLLQLLFGTSTVPTLISCDDLDTVFDNHIHYTILTALSLSEPDELLEVMNFRSIQWPADSLTI
jgi:hypothetical protein